ncbi:hypothetical protein E2562_000097 [Oryza meyeriana var. granulata]|uniref:Uncharacterized protein n=1 Tax=Oryza meyeriana var. granulata TaxID=110450 RepID=A0A6G1DBH1_9ORYZ|nr:hypothetical protein E2562_000097 [Oryza meyeriana var. granulata]
MAAGSTRAHLHSNHSPASSPSCRLTVISGAAAATASPRMDSGGELSHGPSPKPSMSLQFGGRELSFKLLIGDLSAAATATADLSPSSLTESSSESPNL